MKCNRGDRGRRIEKGIFLIHEPLFDLAKLFRIQTSQQFAGPKIDLFMLVNLVQKGLAMGKRKGLFEIQNGIFESERRFGEGGLQLHR